MCPQGQSYAAHSQELTVPVNHQELSNHAAHSNIAWDPVCALSDSPKAVVCNKLKAHRQHVWGLYNGNCTEHVQLGAVLTANTERI